MQIRSSKKRLRVLLFGVVCTTLGCAAVHNRTLAPGPIAFDSTGLAIQLRPAVNEANEWNELCITVDTTRYLIYIRPGLRTLTLRPRRPSDSSAAYLLPAPDSTAIAVDVQLHASHGERAGWETYSFGDGTWECLGSPDFRPGVSYTTLWLRSTRPVVVTKVEWLSRPHGH